MQECSIKKSEYTRVIKFSQEEKWKFNQNRSGVHARMRSEKHRCTCIESRCILDACLSDFLRMRALPGARTSRLVSPVVSQWQLKLHISAYPWVTTKSHSLFVSSYIMKTDALARMARQESCVNTTLSDPHHLLQAKHAVTPARKVRFSHQLYTE